MTMAIYGTGYIARMTRASMAEVMTAQYIRTARLKGLGFGAVVIKHALRNALIAPFTVIMLQFPWLLTGVVVVEIHLQLQGLRLAPGAGGLQQRHRHGAGLRAHFGVAGSCHPTDLRHRIRVPQPAHPRSVGERRMESVGAFGVVLGILARFWPVWIALVVLIAVVVKFKRRLGLLGHLFDSLVGIAGVLICLLLAVHRDFRPRSSRRWTRACRSRS